MGQGLRFLAAEVIASCCRSPLLPGGRAARRASSHLRLQSVFEVAAFQPQGKLTPKPLACLCKQLLPFANRHRLAGAAQPSWLAAESIASTGWVATKYSALFHLQQLSVYPLPLLLPCALLKCPFLKPSPSGRGRCALRPAWDLVPGQQSRREGVFPNRSGRRK